MEALGIKSDGGDGILIIIIMSINVSIVSL